MDKFVIRVGCANSEQIGSTLITRAELLKLDETLRFLVTRPFLDARARASLAPLKGLISDALEA
jgi:hypothetical protein